MLYVDFDRRTGLGYPDAYPDLDSSENRDIAVHMMISIVFLYTKNKEMIRL